MSQQNERVGCSARAFSSLSVMNNRIFRFIPVLLAGALSVAWADDSLITPLYGPGGKEFVAEMVVSRMKENYKSGRTHSVAAEQDVMYGLSDSWTLFLGAAEAREHSLFREEAEDDEAAERETLRERVHSRALTLGVWYTHEFNETDSVEGELYLGNTRTAHEPQEYTLDYTGYYAHQYRRVLGMVRWGFSSPLNSGRENDPYLSLGYTVYTRLGEKGGLTFDMTAERQTASGQRSALHAAATYGYQFNDHAALNIGTRVILHDSGHEHRGESYDRTHHSLEWNVGVRLFF